MQILSQKTDTAPDISELTHIKKKKKNSQISYVQNPFRYIHVSSIQYQTATP